MSKQDVVYIHGLQPLTQHVVKVQILQRQSPLVFFNTGSFMDVFFPSESINTEYFTPSDSQQSESYDIGYNPKSSHMMIYNAYMR
jgi:hypothetical protein